MTASATPRPPTIAGPDLHTRPPRVKLPGRTCDCHAHVFGPQDRFPYLPHAGYIPPDALSEDYARMLRTTGCERAVLVQPSIYGTDNSCMVAAMTSGLVECRGVAVVNETIGDAELERLHRAGVRGIRVNRASETAGLSLAQAPGLAARIQALGWHLQFLVRVDQAPGFGRSIAELPVPCVIDHFGHLSAPGDLQSQGVKSLLELARLKHVWFKLTAPYRVSAGWPLHADLAPLAQALVAAAPDRCVWGTDWPHPNAARMPNDGDLADALSAWLPDAQARRAVLVDNPARFYHFD